MPFYLTVVQWLYLSGPSQFPSIDNNNVTENKQINFFLFCFLFLARPLLLLFGSSHRCRVRVFIASLSNTCYIPPLFFSFPSITVPLELAAAAGRQHAIVTRWRQPQNAETDKSIWCGWAIALRRMMDIAMETNNSKRERDSLSRFLTKRRPLSCLQFPAAKPPLRLVSSSSSFWHSLK